MNDLSFREGEVFPAVGWPDGRLGLHAEIEGNTAILLVSTGVRLDLSLEGTYVLRRGFSILRSNEHSGVCGIPRFRALGRSRPHETAVFFTTQGPSASSNYAGAIEVEYFAGGLLALDAAGPAIGFSTRLNVRDILDRAACRIPLLAEAASSLPITTAITDLHSGTGRPAFLLDSGAPRSSLAWSYVDGHWESFRNRRRARSALRKHTCVPVPLLLPNGMAVNVDMAVEPRPPEYAVDLGVPRLSGVLGIDFLCRWIQVFDFPGRELGLLDYDSPITPT